MLLALARSVRADRVAPLTVLRSWTFQPLVVLALAATAAAYLWGVVQTARSGKSSFQGWKVTCFLAGMGVIYLALQSPIEVYSGQLFWVHMMQHLLLTMVAAPLILLGAPVTLALRASSVSVRRRLLLPVVHSRAAAFLSHPVVSWSLFTATLWVSHFTSLYAEALGSEAVHALEHALYLSAAVLFWRPVVALDPGPSRLSHPGRLLYLFLAMPQMAFLGLAIYSSDQVLYWHYIPTAAALGTSALADQHLAGVLMWTTSMVLMLPAMAFVLFDWMNKDAREAASLDARLDRAASARRLGPLLDDRAVPKRSKPTQHSHQAGEQDPISH
jgi:putative membrane protein